MQQDNEVSMDIHHNDLGCVVRFLRQQYSERLGRSFPSTDLITVVKAPYEDDLKADFEIYRRLPQAAQMQFIDRLRMTPYTGRVLSEADLPVAAKPEPDPDSDPDSDPEPAGARPQMALF